jgi:hypothetical protein
MMMMMKRMMMLMKETARHKQFEPLKAKALIEPINQLSSVNYI